MSLAPTSSLTLGRKRYDSHAGAISVELSLLPGINMARVALPASASVDAGPGDEASLDVDGGEGAETVITGSVAALKRGLSQIEVIVGDAGSRLAAFRPAQTYNQQAGGDVVRSLAEDAGADVGSIDVTLDLASYVAHQRRTAAEHVAEIVRLAGGIAMVDADGRLGAAAVPASPDVALRYGRELERYDVRAVPAPEPRRVAVGNGPAGSASAPNALRHSREPLTAGAPAPGAAARWAPQPVLRTPRATEGASRAADGEAAAHALAVEAHCILLPFLRPGNVVQMADLPDGPAAGPWLLRRVAHRLDGRGGRTLFHGTVAGSSLLGGFL